MKFDSETWNQFLFRKFRAQGNPNFISFLDKFFAKEENLVKYQEGIKESPEIADCGN